MIKNITNVRGFRCWGAHTGVKSLRRDLAIIFSEVPASAAAVFTQNQVVAEPVKVCRENIKNGMAQAIVVNAGNANACTGEQGYEGALAMVRATAESLEIDEDMVLVSSTGVIGEPFPTEEIVNGIRVSAPKVSNRSSAGSFAANAILTTDTFAKEGFIEFSVGGREVNMAGIAKGSGMIHPNMATMLAFIVTDIDIEPGLLQKAVREAVDDTFNMITVDGDSSTNDMVAVLANGMAENERLKMDDSKDYNVFRNRLRQMMEHLSRLIVSDGEGSSKFIEYRVVNGPEKSVCRKIARSISSSNLVKTAMFGRDPNWGRIVSAAGNAGVAFDYTAVDLYLGNEKERVKVLEKGKPVKYDRNFMKKLLRESHISVKLDMCNGEAEATAWGSDLTTDYVLFNSVYTT
ncbi:MAG: bifunctional glutamate N-acetyltransferase/amino-acid acetyltransferase ArgJ [Balneolaceae bacterium]|nr:MAG: bifunctional glutamate N-acetyltransferase/amino-acid acetyltransferase ArgJ [Balneolaceae bacterium]